MPSRFPSPTTTHLGHHHRAETAPSHPSLADWRCTRCDKLIGVCRDGGLHLRFSQGHEYFVTLPATAICRGCGTLNRKRAPITADVSQPNAA
jgi:hypothetical protein